MSLSQEGEVSYLLQSLFQPKISGESVHIAGKKAKLQVDFPTVSAGVKEISCHDQFTGVNPEELEGLDNHYHTCLQTGKAKEHLIVSLLNPEKICDNNGVTYEKQGDTVVFHRNGKDFTLG